MPPPAALSFTPTPTARVTLLCRVPPLALLPLGIEFGIEFKLNSIPFLALRTALPQKFQIKRSSKCKCKYWAIAVSLYFLNALITLYNRHINVVLTVIIFNKNCHCEISKS